MKAFHPSTPAFISWSLLATITTVLLLFGVADYFREKHQYASALQDKTSDTTAQLAASLALPIWNFQDKQSSKIIENAFASEDIVGIVLTDALSDRVVAGFIRQPDKTLLQVPDLTPTPDTIISVQNIMLQDRVLGTIAVQATTKNIDTLAKNSLLRICASIAALDLIIFILLSTVLKRHISTPLKRIESYARDVSMHRETVSPPPDRVFLKELNSVRNSIAIMVDRLQNQYDALNESQAQLDEAEIRYRDLYENAFIGIFRMTISSRFIAANGALATILGYASPDDLMGMVPSAIDQICAHEQDSQILWERLKQHGQISGYRFPFRRADGEVRIGSLGLRVVRNEHGKALYLDGTLHDITDKERDEEQLRDTNAFIQSILDSMSSVVIGVDERLRITHCNKMAQDITSLHNDAMLGLPLVTVLPRMNFYEQGIRMALAEQQMQSFSTRPYRQDDTIRQESVQVFPAIRKGRRGAVIRVDDVTERVRLEELILQTEKMMSVGGLAAGMAHEINNPLAGILLGVQNIQRRLSPGLERNVLAALQTGCDIESIQEYMRQRGVSRLLQGIQDSGERAARIVSNMLSFARQSQSHHLAVSLPALLDKSIELASTDYDLKKKFDFKRIEIVREYADDVPEVPCSTTELEQVMLNLLRNAAQSLFSAETPPEAPRIIVRLYRQDNHAILEVEDNGNGVDDKHKRQVFEPFFTTKQPGDGTGLGLSVSYFIVTRNHGGKIWLDTETKQGARFCIALPLTSNRVPFPTETT